MIRSVLAIVAGVVTIGVLAGAGDSVMGLVVRGAFDAHGFSGNSKVLLAMLVYMTVFSWFGGWVTAWIARRGDLRDVRILAGIQFVMTLAANVMLYDRRLLWFYAAGLVLTIPAIVAGGHWRLAAGEKRLGMAEEEGFEPPSESPH